MVWRTEIIRPLLNPGTTTHHEYLPVLQRKRKSSAAGAYDAPRAVPLWPLWWTFIASAKTQYHRGIYYHCDNCSLRDFFTENGLPSHWHVVLGGLYACGYRVHVVIYEITTRVA
jgi:hypothetical protein